jgi:hypothetical protein
MGGHLASEWVATLDRNQWPHCVGIGREKKEPNENNKELCYKLGKNVFG